MKLQLVLSFFAAFGVLLCHADASKFTSSTRLDLLNDAENAKVTGLGTSPRAFSAFIKYSDAACVDSLYALGVEVRTRTASIITANIPYDKLEAVSNLQGVVAVQADERVDYLLDKARVATAVDKVQSGTAPLTGPFLGKGVIVAAVDGGLDFNHPAFRTSDRSELRLKRVWVQDAKTGTPPDGFSNGAEYTTAESIREAKTDLQYWSHGSHVMNIAAGADKADGNNFYGVATEADLAFSNFVDVTTTIADALHYLFKYADSVKQPMVVNMSLGTQMGPHDGTSLVDVAIDELVGPGRIIVGAAGNDGLVEVHIQKTLSEESNTMFAGLAFKADTQGYCPIDIWGEAGKTMKVNVVTVDKSTGKIIYKSRQLDGSKTASGKVTLQKPFDQSSGYFSYASGISPLNGKPNVTLSLAISDFYPDKAIAIIVTGESGSTVHAWTSSTYAVFRKQVEGMDIPDLYTSTSEVGGVAKGIITVGSFNTKKTVILEDGTESATVFEDGAISQFSNRGPSVDGRLKPEIVAPGCQVVSALNSNGGYSEGLVATHKYNGETYYYGTMLGTSMAAPHVAGIIATWLGACPTLTPDDIREIFKKTAKSDEFTGVTPNNDCGYGKIDAYNGLLEVLKNYASVNDVKDDTEDNVICNVENGTLHIVMLDDVDAANVMVCNLAGSVVKNESFNGAFGNEYVMSLDDAPKGAYIVNVATSTGNYSFKILNK